MDLVINLDNFQTQSNLLNDILGISGLNMVGDEDYCMQPMFRITPGFLKGSQHVHGNDVINSGGGKNIVIGDDIRGVSGVELSQVSEIEELRAKIDNLVSDLGARLSTIEVDVDLAGGFTPFDLKVGCDEITTDPEGSTLVSADTLSLIGRSFRGHWFDLNSVNQILARLNDIEITLVDAHAALYEIHTYFLRTNGHRGSRLTNDQYMSRKLNLGNDIITARGKGDFVSGDTLGLFFQSDRPGVEGFQSRGFSRRKVNSWKRKLGFSLKRRETQRDRHVHSLQISAPLNQEELSQLSFDDVPLKLEVADDTIEASFTENIVVGDFALLGLVTSTRNVSAVNLRRYSRSVITLRTRSLQALRPNLMVLDIFKIKFYSTRYSSEVARTVAPRPFGDNLTSTTSDNIILGDIYTGIGQINPTSDVLVLYENANAYRMYERPELSRYFSADTFQSENKLLIDDQIGTSCYVNGELIKFGSTKSRKKRMRYTGGNVKLDRRVETHTKTLFTTHDLLRQMATDLFYSNTLERTFHLKRGFECTNVDLEGYFPSYAKEESSSGLIDRYLAETNETSKSTMHRDCSSLRGTL